GDQKFRVLDLREVYSADTRRGLFNSEEATNDTVHFAKFGNVMVQGVPFFIMDPAKSSTGANIVALKGGGDKTTAHNHPQRVEIPANVTAKRLHLLSGIAGWGWPATKDARPAMKLTVVHADGSSEVNEFINGEHFADYNRVLEVPGSDLAEDLVKKGQLRVMSVDVKKPGPITKVILESYDNGVTPLVVAVTADIAGAAGFPPAVKGVSSKPSAHAAPAPLSIPSDPLGPKEGGKGDGKLAPTTSVSWAPGKTSVLIIGGGSSHNFIKFFGEVDSATLKTAGFTVHYTEDRDQAAAELANADVALISVNRQFFDSPTYRKALFDRVAAGKGVVMLHPGTWYAYPRWPELNAQIVGGGSKGHDKLGPYTVSVLKKDHPIMKGVPATFDVVDELYYMNAKPEEIPAGTAAIEVLAETSPSQKFGKPHPSVWITKNDKTRIVGIALGHDERTHGDAAFKSILVNAVKWCAGK
ncbi:MAG: ThuA domain-containing protein, partial [Roseimicrobium sp.]